MKPAHYVDICRVELLYEYGGYWLDSTCFVTAPIPEWICRQDFFVYMAGHETPYSYSFIQNCFIRARKEPYSAESFAKATAGSFFQKTSYRDAAVPVPGTIMFEMIYGNP